MDAPLEIKPALKDLAARINPILRRNAVVRAGVFGSVARGEASPGSDLDLLVEFAGEKSLLDLAHLKVELEEELGHPVDVLTYRAIYHRLRQHILDEQVPIL
ncbi:MAG: nucleotidyltransferase family protein [Desulfarculus sp.]|nr:nucleotidyltransferase family protein [Desulfarculus sp.]